MRIGIISAIPEENYLLLQQIRVCHEFSYANRLYTKGSWLDHEMVLVFSRWGKVAAAMTATQLIAEFKVDAIIFTGVAGACAPDIQIGDIIIANNLVQHDMDATPFFPRHEIPLIGLSKFQMNQEWKNKAYHAARLFLNNSFQSLRKADLDLFNISSPKVHEGLIATGDKFFASAKELAELRVRLPEALCVEMEGGSVAQVCHEYGIPCTIIRTISDSGNEASGELFPKFVSAISSQYSLGILKELLSRNQSAPI